MTKVNLKSGRTNEYIGYVMADKNNCITQAQFSRQARKLKGNDYLVSDRDIIIVDQLGCIVGSVETRWDFDYNNGEWVASF